MNQNSATGIAFIYFSMLSVWVIPILEIVWGVLCSDTTPFIEVLKALCGH